MIPAWVLSNTAPPGSTICACATALSWHPEQAAAVARVADAAVVGSAIVQTIADNVDANGRPAPQLVDAVLDFTRALADGVRSARPTAG